MIEFEAHGDPKGQPRARARASNGHVHIYDPGDARGWKRAVAYAAQEHKPAKPWTGPIFLEVCFNLPRPKSHFTKNGRIRDAAPLFPNKKPDIDNLVKAVMDALTGVIWRDDKQIITLDAMKAWAGPGRKAGADIRALEVTQ